MGHRSTARRYMHKLWGSVTEENVSNGVADPMDIDCNSP
jgi:hypothetical protein